MEEKEAVEETKEEVQEEELEEVLEEKAEEEVPAEETPAEAPTEEGKEEPKKKKKTGLIIGCVLGGIILLLVVAFLLYFFVVRKNPTPEKVELTDEEIIKDYGKKLEGVILDYKNEEGSILEYEEANTVLNYEYEVFCDVHEIYLDATIFLDQCKIGDKKVSFSYGKKQKEEEATLEDGDAFVYVSKSTHKATLEEPSNKDDYDVYTMHIGERYTNMNLLGETSEYVFFMDNNNVGQMRNYKTDEKLLSSLNYVSAIPIRYQKQYDQEYVAIQKHITTEGGGEFDLWGIFRLSTKQQVIPFEYRSFSSYRYGTKNFHFEAVGDGIVMAERVLNNGHTGTSEYPTGKGVIHYRTGEVKIPCIYNSLSRFDSYYEATYSETGTGKAIMKILDIDGKEYLSGLDVVEPFKKDLILVKEVPKEEEPETEEDSDEESDDEKPTENQANTNNASTNMIVFKIVDINGKVAYTFEAKQFHNIYVKKLMDGNLLLITSKTNNYNAKDNYYQYEYYPKSKKGFIDTINQTYEYKLIHKDEA